jgi:signal transduction histidine kinase
MIKTSLSVADDNQGFEMSDTKTRVENLIAAIEATANERMENFKPVCSSDLLGQLENATLKLFTKVKSIRMETGQALSDLANSNVQLLLWNTALQKINAADSLFYHGGKLAEFYHSIVLSVMEMTRAISGALVIFDAEGKFQECIMEGNETVQLLSIIQSHKDYGLLKTVPKVRSKAVFDTVLIPSETNLTPTSTLIDAPLVIGDRIKGIIYLANKESGEFFELQDDEHIETFFTEEDVDMLALFADYLVRALERADLMIELQNTVKKLQEAQNQLLQSDKLASIGQLAAGVAHEINNPVGFVNSNLSTLSNYINDLLSIIGTYELLETKTNPAGIDWGKTREIKNRLQLDFLKADIPDLLKESLNGLQRVKEIVNDLKNFSYVHEVQWQSADLHQGLDSTLNLLSNEIKYKADLVKNYGALNQVECIPSQLNQVFLNLLVNALQSISDRGIINISTGTEGDTVWITISDNGQGISADNLKRIFDPFFTTKPVGKGTGLGLSLSYSIIQKHHGKIEVQSKVGEGTTFTIILPVLQPHDISQPR